MSELEQRFKQFQESPEYHVSCSYYSLDEIKQIKNQILVKTSSFPTLPTMFAAKDGTPPQPLLLEYYHDDSDDDDYAPEDYDITVLKAFYIDPESGKSVKVFWAENGGSKPRVERGFKFYKLDESKGLQECEITREEDTPCKHISLSID